MKRIIAAMAFALFCFSSIPAHAAESIDQCMTQCDGIDAAVVDKLWSQADEYFHHGDYPRICALDRVITQADPDFVECYSTGGWLMESQGHNSDAEAFYQEGCRNNPDSTAMYYSLGMFYYGTLHDYSAALAIYLQDTHQVDADVNDWKMLAHTYERMNNLTKAVSTWKTIQQRWPNGPAVQANLDRVLAQQKAISPKSL